MIFHLSYHRDGSGRSVNAKTPKEICTIRYPDFTEAIRLCLQEGVNCYCSKSDWKMAFRHFPIKKRFWRFLIMKAQNPLDGSWNCFIDKCMPFGSSISCSHFQGFSNAIAYVMAKRTGKENVNYLDDFLFISLLCWFCNHQVNAFLEICRTIRFPVALEKICWATNLIIFLGMLIDTRAQLVLIPRDKIQKVLQQIETLIQ